MISIGMPSDALIASFCGLIYSPLALLKFDHFDAGEDDGVCWALKCLPGFDVVVFRGSITALDWIRDMRALAIRTRVGHVHIGFHAGMEHVWNDLKPLINQPCIVAGHSLGAARAAVLAALMVADGVNPVGRVVLGEPKPGMLDFATVLKDVPGRSYRNGDDLHHDLVTDLPLSFPPLQYVHPTPIIPVFCKPHDDEFVKDGIFAWHHWDLYETALNVLLAQSKEQAT